MMISQLFHCLAVDTTAIAYSLYFLILATHSTVVRFGPIPGIRYSFNGTMASFHSYAEP